MIGFSGLIIFGPLALFRFSFFWYLFPLRGLKIFKETVYGIQDGIQVSLVFYITYSGVPDVLILIADS